jgi:hypothetical protein
MILTFKVASDLPLLTKTPIGFVEDSIRRVLFISAVLCCLTGTSRAQTPATASSRNRRRLHRVPRTGQVHQRLCARDEADHGPGVLRYDLLRCQLMRAQSLQPAQAEKLDPASVPNKAKGLSAMRSCDSRPGISLLLCLSLGSLEKLAIQKEFDRIGKEVPDLKARGA